MRRFTDTAGGVHETALEGYAHGGTNAADVELCARGEPRTTRTRRRRRSTRPRARLATGFSLRDLNGALFYGVFGSASRPLAPGHYPGAVTDWPSPVPWLRFNYSNSGCEEPGGGEFTLDEFRRMPDEELRSFDVEFTALCQDDGQVWPAGAGASARARPTRCRTGSCPARATGRPPGDPDDPPGGTGDPPAGTGDPPGGAGDPSGGVAGVPAAADVTGAHRLAGDHRRRTLATVRAAPPAHHGPLARRPLHHAARVARRP